MPVASGLRPQHRRHAGAPAHAPGRVRLSRCPSARNQPLWSLPGQLGFVELRGRQGHGCGLQSLISYGDFIAGITSSGSGDLTGPSAAGTTTYNGQIVAVYKDDDGTEAYFAADGPAYLLAIVDSSSSGGGVPTFVWNRPTTVTAPPASQIYTG